MKKETTFFILMLMIMAKKNLISTERTSGMRLEPGVYARNMEAVLAFQQLPQPFTIHNFMEANHAIWGLVIIVLYGMMLLAKGERRDVVFSPEYLCAQSYGKDDGYDDNGVLAICCGCYTASYFSHHQLHLIFHHLVRKIISKLFAYVS